VILSPLFTVKRALKYLFQCGEDSADHPQPLTPETKFIVELTEKNAFLNFDWRMLIMGLMLSLALRG
jgi:hypothetical protein